MKHILVLTAMALLALSAASCNDKEADKPKAAPAPAYSTMTLQARQIAGQVQLPGVMQPFQFVQLYPRISGFVKTVAADRGSAVKKGQVLATLEAPEVLQQVAAARLAYAQAQATYTAAKDRYRRLLETSRTPGTIAPYDLEAAAAKMHGDSATAQGAYAGYRAQEALMAYLTITAPFDGVITERNIHPGALAGPGSGSKPMLVLQQVSKLRLAVELPEQYAAQVKDGDKVAYKVNSLPGRVFAATISRSSHSLSSNFRSEGIEIDVDNAQGMYTPGMYAEVTLPVSGSANAFVVPRSAIVTTTEKKYVIAVAGNMARWVDVTEGNQNNDSTEIFCTLQNSDKLITNATYRIKNGAQIAVQ